MLNSYDIATNVFYAEKVDGSDTRGKSVAQPSLVSNT